MNVDETLKILKEQGLIVASFKDYLSIQEERQFMYEEDKIDKQRRELYKKYNKIASDRLSHEALIKEIKNIAKNSTDDFHKLLISMENTCLQQILNVLIKMRDDLHNY